ncbi:unnamed protein product [Parajaminaea phylloscopi]
MSRPSMMPPVSSGPASSTGSGARSSLYPSMSSSVDPAASSSSSSLAARLAAKQAELEGLRQLRDYSALLVKELDKMGDGLDEIRNGGESVAQVMSAWQTVFRGIQVAQASVAQRTHAAEAAGGGLQAGDDGEEAALATMVPDTLVRVPVGQSHPARSGQEAEQDADHEDDEPEQ